MAEIKKLWIVSDPMKIDGSYTHYWEDPAIQDHEHRLMQICGALGEGGYGIDQFVRIYEGTRHGGAGRWEKEHTKVYDNASEARQDAEKRMAKARKAYERESEGEGTSDRAKKASRLAARFRGQGG